MTDPYQVQRTSSAAGVDVEDGVVVSCELLRQLSGGLGGQDGGKSDDPPAGEVRLVHAEHLDVQLTAQLQEGRGQLAREDHSLALGHHQGVKKRLLSGNEWLLIISSELGNI